MATALRVPVESKPTRTAPSRPALHVVPGAARELRHVDAWVSVSDVVVGEDRVDHVTVGPNGVFVVVVDPEPGELTAEGIVRDGDRVKEPVKRALRAAHTLSREIDVPGLFAYPILLTGPGIEPGYLGRLRVVGLDRFAETLWCHPGRPMLRSERTTVVGVLRELAASDDH